MATAEATAARWQPQASERIHGENCNQPIAVIIDGRFRNIASLKTRGVDVVLDYFLNMARGKVSASPNGTYTID